MMQEMKVSGNRIGALIGKGGAVKQELEKKTGTVITIDGEEGVVRVEGESAVPFLRAMEVISAINRGFSPERAFQLLEDEDLVLELIDLSALADSPRRMDRLRGRIIGRDGKSREQIENMTSTQISVFGKSIAIIGLPEQMKVARAAIDMLLEGAPHEAVFSFLEKKRQEAKQGMMDYYY
jgi:ribosomal RNA assembly protein